MSPRRTTPRAPQAVLTTIVVFAVLAISGCQFEGMNSYTLPGTVGTGDDAYTVRVELPDASTLTENAEVKVANVTVGTISDTQVQNWHAVLTVSLSQDVDLPANATATVGQSSLLGASYLELAAPTTEPPRGRLSHGDTIPLSSAGAYPSTEQVLAAVSLVLNGSGLGQLDTIVTELNRALGGQHRAVADLIPRLTRFVTGLEAQKTEIIAAIDGLNRLSGRFAQQDQVLVDALENVEPALEVLNRERADLTTALAALGDLGKIATQVIARSRDDLVGVLRELEPTLQALARAEADLVGALEYVGTYPFPTHHVQNTCFGDYCNVYAVLDLTLSTLDARFLSGTPLQGELAALERLLGQNSGVASEAIDPLRGPLQEGGW